MALNVALSINIQLAVRGRVERFYETVLEMDMERQRESLCLLTEVWKDLYHPITMVTSKRKLGLGGYSKLYNCIVLILMKEKQWKKTIKWKDRDIRKHLLDGSFYFMLKRMLYLINHRWQKGNISFLLLQVYLPKHLKSKHRMVSHLNLRRPSSPFR